jgi:dolichol-phosphate mannosyltransferase
METRLDAMISRLQGPILVLGASGFIGSNLFMAIARRRRDVFGVVGQQPAWRLEKAAQENVIVADLLVESNLINVLDMVKPGTVFNLVAYGAYSFETNAPLIYRTNLNLTTLMLEEMNRRGVSSFVNAGSSSEYGDVALAPPENAQSEVNSHYSVSKLAASHAIRYFGKKLGFPCVNLRLYSVYGPYEDSSRLIPALVAMGERKELPEFVNPSISRDFIYIDDVCDAFVTAALKLEDTKIYGESFNVGTGVKTTIGELANLARDVFGIAAEPRFTMPSRDWDVEDWRADVSKAKALLNWEAKTSLREGLSKTAEWYRGVEDKERYHKSSKKFGLDAKRSVSAIIACYKDAQAIPIMYRRLKEVFAKLNVEHEIIFVNDGSPDNSEEVIREISVKDRRVVGVSHSRNFGSQAAFRSGMELSTKNSCVLLDGDLQDPPELIEQFVGKWQEGFDIVYGRRVKREGPYYMQALYKLFYRVFDAFSYIDIPHDAGDFSLIDKKVARCILRFPERDLFLRGIRAYVGFRQAGVDYTRPERMFGVTTNSFFKNIGWAKKGILSFSYTPLSALSFFGVTLLFLSILLSIVQVGLKMIWSESAPHGVTTTILIMTFFGSVNLLGISVLGEYIAKILEEVKRRPHFLRKSIIVNGETRAAMDAGPGAE